MCRQAGVSRSGYYSYAARKEGRAASARESRDYADFALVRTVFDYKGRPKGSRTISMMMPRLFGVAMNRKKVRRLMRKYGLECPARRANPLKRIAKAIQSNAVFSNKLNRQFAVGRPGENLLTDISYIRYGPHLEKLCFLSALKDASTNEIVALFVGVELLAFAGVENPLAHSDGMRSDFDELIEVDVVEASFERHLARGLKTIMSSRVEERTLVIGFVIVQLTARSTG
jgi:hypothetical protein